MSEAGKAEAAAARAQDGSESDSDVDMAVNPSPSSPSMVTPGGPPMPPNTPAAPTKADLRTQRKQGAGKRKKDEWAERSLAVME